MSGGRGGASLLERLKDADQGVRSDLSGRAAERAKGRRRQRCL